MFKSGNGFTDLSDTASITAQPKVSMANCSSLSSSQKRSALAIFCRAPRLGTVKTRLAQTHGDAFALQLYRAMILDTFALGRALAPDVETFACFTPGDGFEGENSLAELWNGPKIAQCEGDLGAKILDCFAQLRARGFENVVIIGSDAPDLPLTRLQESFAQLDTSEVVIGESCDGGFYLLGASTWLPDNVFEDIVWSSDQVFARLLLNIKTRFSLSSLPNWRDVDDAEDLLELRRRLFELGTRAPHTREFLEKN